MDDFEKLGVFYLGKEYELAGKVMTDNLVLYDSKDLVTHAVAVGMTGSGKTGLCVGLIEEAAIDGIPSILIDPKGDLGNLLLTFPELRGEDFLPWINLDAARQKGMTPQDYAESQAALWKKGLSGWGEDGARIQRLKDAADFAIYTPASNAGIPVSILKSFAAPDPAIIADVEMLRDRISSTVTSLLGLLGIDADPIQSREYILLSTILDLTWRQGQDLDLASLIGQVQTPPVTKIGVLDLESFYPSKERFGLVMALNNLLASPGFSAWMEGEALDIGHILYTPQGKPRVAIFSIAHLSDRERMFFVSLLLNQVLSWMRGQSGTTSLRALLYIDEIFGYLPPTSNPPSKLPLLTMLKQARAFGVGVVLATQNPVDLDYKALSNAGTWFVGRLQTERDKARLLDGLEGAAATTGGRFDRGAMEQTIAGLGSRVFLMNNTHEDEPVIFHTRWAMSYLRGPITREQIKVLMAPRKALAEATEAITAQPTVVAQPSIAATTPVAVTATVAADVAPAPTPSVQPTLPPDVSTFFIPARGSRKSSTVVYRPWLLGAARVHFNNVKANVDKLQDVVALTAITDSPIPVDWAQAEMADIDLSDLDKRGEPDAKYDTLPAAAGQSKSYTAWNKAFATWVYRTQKLEMLRSPSLKQQAEPGEAERDFRIRMQQLAREQRDEMADALRKKYASKITTLQERVRKAEQAVEREQAQVRQAGLQSVVNVGATVLGAFLGRKAVSSSTVGKAATAAKSAGRVAQQREDVERAKETVEALEKQLADLQAEFETETEKLAAKIDPMTEEMTTVVVKPRKADISVQLVTLVWAPHWDDEEEGLVVAW